MCVILVGKVDRKLHESAKKTNPDGFSLYTKEQGLIKDPSAADVTKALNTFGIWHYRIGTSGKKDKNNIHPFIVARGAAYLYHNGILGEGDATRSDTNMLAETLRDCSIETCNSVLKSLAHGNRFLLVDSKDPRSFRVYGDWFAHKGVLMSNRNSIPVSTPYVYYRGGKYSHSTGYSQGGYLSQYSRKDLEDDLID